MPASILGPGRRGVVLLMVSAIAAMLLALTVAFLARMRGNATEAGHVVADGQARAMLHAALGYLAESSRLGWQRDAAHARSWGWTDVRDGSIGPRYDDGSAAWDEARWAGGVPDWNPSGGAGQACYAAWPAPGAFLRAPLYVMHQAPFALQRRYAHNPVAYDGGGGAHRWLQPTFGELDPLPAQTDFRLGDPEPRLGSAGRAWFRLYRERAVDHDGRSDGAGDPDSVDLGADHGIFIVTCGAGGTLGYRSASEAPSGTFGGDAASAAAVFERLRAEERLLWYRVAWSGWAPDVAGEQGRWNRKGELRPLPPLTGLDPAWNDDNSRSGSLQMAPFGTFRFIQRLQQEPPRW
jgi:hypothetical protein